MGGNGYLGYWPCSNKSSENLRSTRMSQGFAALREMNYKYFQLGHWKCFPLQSSSQEICGGGEPGAGRLGQALLRVSSSADC